MGGAPEMRPTTLFGTRQMIVGHIAVADHHPLITGEQAIGDRPGPAVVIGEGPGGQGAVSRLRPDVAVLPVLSPAGLIDLLTRAGPTLRHELRPLWAESPTQPGQRRAASRSGWPGAPPAGSAPA